MGKLLLSIAVGAVLMSFADDWKRGDLSISRVIDTVQYAGRALVSLKN
jgi:hypothetical protein